VTVFPDEIYAAPKSWAERAYPKMIYFSKLDKGGHFAAWEQPEVFTAEMRAALKELLAGPIICMPVETTEGHRYRVSGALAVGRLVSTGAFAASPTRLVESPCTEPLEIQFINGRLAA